MNSWLALAGAAAATAIGAVGAHSVFVAPRSLRIARRDVTLPRLGAAFDGYQILHLSDLHLGGLASGAEHVVVAGELATDLVVVTGDMIEDSRYADACGRLLGAISARDGVVCVLGNHDHYAIRRSGGDLDLARLFCRYGVRTLVNSAFAIERDGTRLWLAGVDDPHGRASDLDRAFRNLPANEPCLLLAHSPDICSTLPAGRADLVLTGHCHGGQIRTPWGPIVTRTRRQMKEVLGLQEVDGTLVHMSAGLGSTIPLRFLCPPEATVLRLTCADDRTA